MKALKGDKVWKIVFLIAFVAFQLHPAEALEKCLGNERETRLKCGFLDSSQWSKCEWTHQDRTILKVVRSSDGKTTSKNEFDNMIQHNATLDHCDLIFKEVSIEALGRWKCSLTTETFKNREVDYDIVQCYESNVTIRLDRAHFVQNREAKIYCHFTEGYPEAQIMAYIVSPEGKTTSRLRLKRTELSTAYPGVKRGIFSYLPDVRHINSSIACQAVQFFSNQAIFKPETRLKIEAVFHEPIFIQLPLNEIHVQGDKAVLEFKIRANPLPSKNDLKWEKVIENNLHDRKYKELVSSKIVIEQTSFMEMFVRISLTGDFGSSSNNFGTYRLRVSNLYGSISYEIELILTRNQSELYRNLSIGISSVAASVAIIFTLTWFAKKYKQKIEITKAEEAFSASQGLSPNSNASFSSTSPLMLRTPVLSSSSIREQQPSIPTTPIMMNKIQTASSALEHEPCNIYPLQETEGMISIRKESFGYQLVQDMEGSTGGSSFHPYDQIADTRRFGRSMSILTMGNPGEDRGQYDCLTFTPRPNNPLVEHYNTMSLSGEKASFKRNSQSITNVSTASTSLKSKLRKMSSSQVQSPRSETSNDSDSTYKSFEDVKNSKRSFSFSENPDSDIVTFEI